MSNTREWDPEEYKAALDTELAVHDDLNHKDVSLRKFRESVALATDRIIHIALYSENEPLSAKCATYIIDRVHGKVTDTPTRAKDEDGLEKMLREIHAASAN